MLDTLVFAPKLITEVFDSVVASSAWMDAIRIDWSGTPEFPYVTRSALNNGISAIIPKQKMDPNPGNTITIGVDTQTVHYQPHDYYASVKIQALRAERLNPATAMVLVAALRGQMSKFAWGNGVSLQRLRRSQVMVPVNEDGDVDWDGMERYGRMMLLRAWHEAQIPLKVIERAGLTSTSPKLRFAPKLITEVFDSVVASSAWMDAIRIDWSGTPEFPYVTRSALNNGISAIIPKQKMDPNPGNTITIGVSTQTVHYQPHDYYCGKEIQALRAKRLNLATAMVLVPALRAQVSKLAWGNGVSLKRLRRSQVMVPVNENGDVDWDGMERYGRWLLSQARRPLEVAPAASSS